MSNQTPNFLHQEHANETASFVFDASDEEANEDLSLKIVEKALSLQNIAQNGVVDAAAVVKKRKKKKKLHSENQSVFVGKEEENAEIVEKANTNGKEKAGEETPVSGEPEIVELADNMVLRKLLRGPRYFDPPDSGWSTCYNCGEEGHMAVNCKLLEKKRKPCFVCGSLDHGARQCSKGQDCFICKKSGHRAKDCPEKGQTAEKNSRICLKCGDSGHEMFTCRNNYSTDDLKEIQCYVCKRFGHLCCADSVDDSPLEVSCYKCGDLGHTGLACSRLRDEGTVHASPSSCYKCGNEGHFARECTSSLKACSRLRDEGTVHASPSSCYKCGNEGHFARECTSSSKAEKRSRELIHSILRTQREDREKWGSKSAPHDLGKAPKKRKTKSEKKEVRTPHKSKKRGGWIVDDPGDFYDYDDNCKRSRKSKHRDGWSMQDPEDYSRSKSSKNHGKSLSTPPSRDHRTSHVSSNGHKSRSHYKEYKNYSTSRSLYAQGSSPGFQQRYLTSRFGSSSNSGTRRGHDWW